MWSYYGSKSKIIDLYPPPVYGKIIEPFAGTARYALKYFDREVLLVDKYPVIVAIWQWLQQCSERDIQSLPRMKRGQKVSDFNLHPVEAQYLMGFICKAGGATPANTGSFFACENRPNLVNFQINRIANSLHKIKHWEIRLGDYEEIQNEQATWFIDPPYQFGGEHYKMSSRALDFGKLAEWCKSRNGQAIVCESTRANWLDFVPMRKVRAGLKDMHTEAIWSNMPTAWDMQQVSFL